MKKTNIVILKRKDGGLQKLVHKGVVGNPKEYGTNSTNRDVKGQLLGDYKEASLPGAKHSLHLFYSDLKKQWCWGGTQEELTLLVQKMKLKYPDNHHERGKFIKEADVTDFYDPFFTHAHWEGRRYMEQGRIMLNLDIPEDKVFYLSYRGNHKVHDQSQDQNSTFVRGATYELINPKVLSEDKQRDYKAEADATILLSDMGFEKQQIVAEIMDLVSYNRSDPDPNRLFIALTDEGVRGTEKVARYGSKTGRQRFVELANLNQEDLTVMAQVIRAKKLAILRNRGTYWQFNTGTSTLPDRIETGPTDNAIINFFRNAENSEYYVELVHQLEAKNQN